MIFWQKRCEGCAIANFSGTMIPKSGGDRTKRGLPSRGRLPGIIFTKGSGQTGEFKISSFWITSSREDAQYHLTEFLIWNGECR